MVAVLLVTATAVALVEFNAVVADVAKEAVPVKLPVNVTALIVVAETLVNLGVFVFAQTAVELLYCKTSKF